jgi:hypothetical protein
LLDDAHEFVHTAAVSAGELNEFLGLSDHGAALGRAGDGDAAAAAEFK